MKRPLTVLAAAAAMVALVLPALAGELHRHRHAYAVGAISRDVITPYYVGYYGSHYSYFPPDSIYYRVHVIEPPCWRWSKRRRHVCWIAP